jgi:lysophospholipase L1-like esterase
MWVQEDGTNRHPLPEYLVGLREILEWLRDHTEARVVFALTTPVDQERQRQSNYGRVVRRNEDIPAYNTPTRALVESLDMGVDDLYGVVMAVGVDNVIADDGVHFRPEGYELLGKAVAACILRELST